MKPIFITTAAVLLLTGCAKINNAGMQLVASSTPAVAVIEDALLSGKITFQIDRTGTLNLTADDATGLQCGGNLRYTATRSGAIHLQCSNGATVSMTFNAQSEVSGHAAGRSATGKIASLAFGMEPESAMAFLRPPAGKRLVNATEGGLRLE